MKWEVVWLSPSGSSAVFILHMFSFYIFTSTKKLKVGVGLWDVPVSGVAQVREGSCLSRGSEAMPI